MKFTEQTELGPNGNCLSACLSTFINLPLDAIPNFKQFGLAWFRPFIDLCSRQNVGVIYLKGEDVVAGLYSNVVCIGVYEVLHHPDVFHAVIIKRGLTAKEGIKNWICETEVLFDPSPEPVALGKLQFVLIFQKYD